MQLEITCKKNSELVKKYGKERVRNSPAKETRLKHLLIILNLTRMLNRDWEDVIKEDIEGLVFNLFGNTLQRVKRHTMRGTIRKF